ncbi:TlpA disulfide reductase family protein [Niastella populi]|uniref:Thioredoxin n=1 Tax=Niastella populi TaxID=550983 RepID=A0A1V9FKZ5_9BACT|nr:TlpA disulfide reductase family protein [Niastella populi]OQP58896.1 thioredoxin [Niastella populi]
MKKTVISMFLALPLLAAAQKGYVITGKLTNLKEPAKAYLDYGRGNDAFKDSAEIKNGRFMFKGRVKEPVQAFVAVKRSSDASKKRNSDYVVFFLENSKIAVTATDSIKKATIKGSLAEKENQEMQAPVRPLTDIILKLNNEFDTKKNDTVWRKWAGDSVTKLVKTIKDLHVQFVETHLNSFMGLYAYNVYVLDSKFETAKVEPLFRRFSPELQKSELGQRIVERLEAGSRRATGVKATDFTQNDLNDKPFTLSSLKGKYVLVDFWASWCAPCRAENPNLLKAYTELKAQNKNFEVVAVSLDQGKSSWEGAVKKDGMPWIHVSDLKGWQNEVAVKYGINAVPQNLLINPEGVIIAKNLRGEGLTEKLSAYIK